MDEQARALVFYLSKKVQGPSAIPVSGMNGCRVEVEGTVVEHLAGEVLMDGLCKDRAFSKSILLELLHCKILIEKLGLREVSNQVDC